MVGFDIFQNIDNDTLMLILIHAPIMIGLIIENIVYKDKLLINENDVNYVANLILTHM